MRLNEFTGKEIIDISDGARLGVIEECELILDETSGRVSGIILPRRKSFFDFRSGAQNAVIPWESIKRIGDDVIIVDLSYENGRGRKLLSRDF